jgi:hypothetical protein
MRTLKTAAARIALLLTFAGGLATPLFAEKAGAPAGAPFVSAVELIGRTAYEEAQSAGKAVRVSSGSAPALLPAHAAAEAYRAALAAEKPSVLVEAVFVLPRHTPEDAAARAAELASVYGLMRSLGSLQGIEYWSASRNTWRTFYAESYCVDSPETKRRLADPPAPEPKAVPASESVFAFQRDLSFGANYYRYDFRSYSDALSVESTNLTRMSYDLIPVMAAGALKTRLLVIQASDAIIFYAASGADAPGIFRSKLEASFGNRAEALFRWFSKAYK